MNSLLLYLAQASACLLAFYGFYHLVLRKETCFQYNRAYLLLSPSLSFLLPLAPLPGWLASLLASPPSNQSGTVMVEAGYGTQVFYETQQMPAAEPFDWQPVFWTLYGLGLCFVAYRLFRQLWTIRHYIRQHQAEIVCRDGLKLVPTRGQSATFSFLNYLFYDSSQDTTEQEWQQILRHESVHITQKHTWDILYLELLTMLFWFNPLLYFYKKALASTHEFIADAAVTRTVAQQEYATLLVKQVFSQMDLSLGHYFNKSLTLKRMNMLQRNHLRPNRLKQVLALPLLALLFVLVAAKNPPLAEEMEESASAKTEQRDNLIQAEKSRTAPAPATTGLVLNQDQEPTFPGGKAALQRYLKKNIKYPAQALKNGITGQAIIQVTVDEQGRVGNFKTLQADNPYFEQEVIRVLKDMPDWQPGARKETLTLAFPFLFGLENNKGLPALKVPASKTKFALQDAIIVVGYSQVIPGKTVTQSSAAPATQYPRDSKVFSFVEQVAEFPGGQQAMNDFISKNLKYPAEALKSGKEGLVVVQFVVDRNGKIFDPAVVKPLGPEFDEETLRLVKSFPDFRPASQNGKPVEFRLTLPIRFGLSPKDPANGYIPPSKANPAGSYLSTGNIEPKAPTDCQPRLIQEHHLDMNNGSERILVTFHYRLPAGCPGETYQIETLDYFLVRGKAKLGHITIKGNTFDSKIFYDGSKPGDVINIIVKGHTIPTNGKAAVPFFAGTTRPVK
jgi:TonB family protein